MCAFSSETQCVLNPTKILEREKEWREHIGAADATREVYRDSFHTGNAVVCDTLSILPRASISHNHDNQLSVTMLSEQTMNEWFAQEKE